MHSWVDMDAGFDVHRPIGCRLKLGSMPAAVTNALAPKALKDALPKKGRAAGVYWEAVQPEVRAAMKRGVPSQLRCGRLPRICLWLVWSEAADKGC